MPARLNPYLTFPGNAREAMEYYRGVLGGKLTISTFAEGGMAQDPADADRIMHAELETDSGFSLMGSDAPNGTPSPMSGVQVSLSGDAGTDAELSGYYDKLAQGGTVVEPLEQAPWGDKFGMVTDPYGVLWMVNISGPDSGQ
jgi:PhnB protein